MVSRRGEQMVRNIYKQIRVSRNMLALHLLSACIVLVTWGQSAEAKCIMKPYGVKMCQEMCSRLGQCSTPLYRMRDLTCSLPAIKGVKPHRVSSRKLVSKMKGEVLIKRKFSSCGCKKFRAGKEKICIRIHHEKKSWYEAETICKSCNGRLVKADSKAKLKVMQKLVGWKKMMNADTFYWTGGKDLHGDNRYYWTDRSPLGINRWGRDEPSHVNVFDGVKVVEDCIGVMGYLTKGLLFHDTACTSRQHFICERVRSRSKNKCSYVH